MNDAFCKRLLIFAMPVTLLTAAYVILPCLVTLPANMRENTGYILFVIFAAGIFLSLYFNRSRAVFVLLILAAAFWSLTIFPSQPLFTLLCLLVPFNVTLFCLMREKGITTLSGRMRLGFIAVQAALVASVIRSCPAIIQPLAVQEIMANRQLPLLELPQSAVIVMGIGLTLIAGKTYIRQNPVDSGLFGVLAAFFITCNRISPLNFPLVFIAAGGLILILGVLQESYNMAFRDDLTGLPSRRALNEDMPGFGQRYTVAMLDVDHFKKVNDTYGHDVGDQVLKMVAGKIRAVGLGSRPYRYGGEEFTIVFPKKTAAEVIPCLEELRKKLAVYQLWIRGETRPNHIRQGRKMRTGRNGDQCVSVTLSIGIAEKNDELRTPGEVIKAADHALYRAKNKGRNRLSS